VTWTALPQARGARGNSENEPGRQSGPPTGLDAGTWETAPEMYHHRYSFIAVGPRAHEDRLPDVAAVTHREVGLIRSFDAS